MEEGYGKPGGFASYIVALSLILTAGFLMVAIVKRASVEYVLYLSTLLLGSVLFVKSRNEGISGIEIASLALYIIFVAVGSWFHGSSIFIVIIGASLLGILLFNSIRGRNAGAIASILLMGLFTVNNHSVYWFESLILMSTIVTLAGSKRIHSILTFIVTAPLIMLSSNTPLIMYLITLSFILFSINSSGTGMKCPFRKEIILVMGGFAIQAGGILIGLIVNDPYQIFSYWVLGYIISAVGLTSPPFYSIDLEEREGGL